jgi:hypothetical protein
VKKPAITFIGELEKQVWLGLVLFGEGSLRYRTARPLLMASIPTRAFKYRNRIWFLAADPRPAAWDFLLRASVGADGLLSYSK